MVCTDDAQLFASLFARIDNVFESGEKRKKNEKTSGTWHIYIRKWPVWP